MMAAAHPPEAKENVVTTLSAPPVFRVAAYAVPMTEIHPPFRLDRVGGEPPAGAMRATSVVRS
jgi:hypothetical protein